MLGALFRFPRLRPLLAFLVGTSVLVAEPALAQSEGQIGASGLKYFATINTEKNQFLVHAESAARSSRRIEALCDGTSSANCGKHLKSYKGLRGTLLSSDPVHKNNVYLWFPVAMENGEHLFLRVPRWRSLARPFDASEHLVDVQDLNRAQAMVGEGLLLAPDLSVAGYAIESGTIMLVLDNGVRLGLTTATQSLAFLNNFALAHDHALALAVFTELEVRQLGEHEWRVRPKAANSMLVYGELIVGKATALQMVVNHSGSGAVYFNAVEVDLPSQLGPAVYRRTFGLSDIDRTIDAWGRVAEQARVAVAPEEMHLLIKLTETAAQITLDGRYPVTGEIDRDQAGQLRALLDLHSVIEQRMPIKLAGG